MIGGHAALGGVPAAFAQAVPGASPGAPVHARQRTAADLEELVGPIALYPDDLVAIVLPAATTPLELVKAQRFLDKRNSNPALQPDPGLPEAVRNLLNYPSVVQKMNDDLDWTERLGQAVMVQQKDVMDAVQAFRRRVHAAGNLRNDDKQVIVVEREVIKVVQANPQVIYVPQYRPSVVVVADPAYAYTYYPTPYPVYYYSYPPGATFATGFFFGAATAYAVHWAHHEIDHHYDVRELQEERLDYARESREDWQDHQREMQSRRSDDIAERQGQRQEAAAERPAQRQQVTGGQGSQPRTQMAGAQGSQPRTQLAGAQGPRTAGTRAGDPPYAGDGGSAFGGLGSGADASRSSLRGSQSRLGGGRAAGIGIGRR